ncbi:maleylpyruvate isomerase family mycothiol-dependent enzyme [Ilumatobacter sp.]|uniref:maleylpyruvate isomerase family mycothiol-dependent enzyme n=1 Tax=Ilumatobacter sp. TaxID=1967498 RepID=UPI003C476B13
MESFVEFARTLDNDDWLTPVPCTPLWTARDLLSHVSGVPDDVLAGRVDGAATDPWTALQVQRNADATVDELLARWETQTDDFGAAIEAIGEFRPPLDCHSHEHDLRQALGRPGSRDSELVTSTVAALLGNLADVPVSIEVDLDDGATIEAGDPSAGDLVGLSASTFEIFRSMLGRRTRAQVRGLEWSGDPASIDRVVDSWFIFGPSEIAIIE